MDFSIKRQEWIKLGWSLIENKIFHTPGGPFRPPCGLLETLQKIESWLSIGESTSNGFIPKGPDDSLPGNAITNEDFIALGKPNVNVETYRAMIHTLQDLITSMQIGGFDRIQAGL